MGISAYRYFMPTEVLFGRGTLTELEPRYPASGQRPLLVTGTASAQRSGLLDRVSRMLATPVHFEAPENPDDAVCDAGARVCRDAKCDAVIAVGGGSAMDCAKAIAGLALNDGPCASYFGSEKFTRGALPIIAVPTTSGTGSEVTPYAVLTSIAENTKRTIGARCLFPHLAILDPELPATMPASVTAHTGLDALSQAMEGMVSKKATRLGDALAIEACTLIARHLGRVCRAAGDIEAREAMHHAAMLSGCVIAQSGTTLVHGMGYYFTLECGVPHGLANALLLAPVFRFNARHAPAAVAALATALGHPASPEPDSAAKAITTAIHALICDCGLSPKARDAGVAREQLARFTASIVDDPYRFRNQIGDVSRDDVLRFFEESYDGI